MALFTAVTSARNTGSTKELISVLDSGLVEVDGRDIDDMTALHHACQHGLLNVAEVLVGRGASALVVTRFGETALIFAARHGHSTVVSFLLEHVHVTGQHVEEGLAALREACLYGQVSVVRVLVGGGVALRRLEWGRATFPLAAAASEGHSELVSVLCDLGADVNEVDKEGQSALLLACRRSRLQVIECLLDRGADTSLVTKRGLTALDEVLERGYEKVALLLLSRPFPWRAVEPGCQVTTALHRAVKFGIGKRVLERLIACGADVNALNEWGQTPLLLASACVSSTASEVSFLLAHGALVSSCDPLGRSALHKAAGSGNPSVVTVLLHHGLSPSALDMNGCTPIMLAQGYARYGIEDAFAEFKSRVCDEWRRSTHLRYPLPFQTAVATTLALWSWNSVTDCAWHPESPFLLLSLELMLELFVWLAADISDEGYVID